MGSNGFDYNYIHLLKAYYHFGFPKLIGKYGHPVFTTILHKANDARWKKKVQIPNWEITDMTDLSWPTIRRARLKIVSVKYNKTWVMKLYDGSFNTAPSYQINYKLLNELYLSMDKPNNHKALDTPGVLSEHTPCSTGTPEGKTEKSDVLTEQTPVPVEQTPVLTEHNPNRSNKSNKKSKSKKHTKVIQGDAHILPNGMTWEAFRQLLEFKVGVIKIGTEDNDKYRESLETEPEEKLIEAVKYVKTLGKPPSDKKSVPIRYILERVHGYIDQWDYHQEQKKQVPRTLQQKLDAAIQYKAEYQKQVDAAPEYADDQLTIETLAMMQKNIDDYKEHIANEQAIENNS